MKAHRHNPSPRRLRQLGWPQTERKAVLADEANGYIRYLTQSGCEILAARPASCNAADRYWIIEFVQPA